MSKYTISSLQNPLVKHLVRLRKDRAYRTECKTALVTGEKTVRELALSLPPLRVLHTEETLPLTTGDHALVPIEILKKITALPAPEGIVAEFPIPQPSLPRNLSPLLVLDGLTDPGNMGNLVRTALALGWKGVFLLPGSADLFQDKTIRASRGASFLLPYTYGSWEDVRSIIGKQNLTPLVAHMEGTPLAHTTAERPLLILSSEAHGSSPEALAIGQLVSIPMPGPMESLNVAVAGAILMYTLLEPR